MGSISTHAPPYGPSWVPPPQPLPCDAVLVLLDLFQLTSKRFSDDSMELFVSSETQMFASSTISRPLHKAVS